MQLSIEAIIVLVIAIVLLGLGIAFIKNFFGKGSDALLGSFDPINERCDVSADNPVIPKDLSVTQGETKQVKICVYNNQNANIPNAVLKISQCVDPSGDKKPLNAPTTGTPLPTALPNDEIKITTLAQNIDRGKTVGYKATLAVASAPANAGGAGSELGTYICNVVVECDGSTCANTGKINTQMSIAVN